MRNGRHARLFANALLMRYHALIPAAGGGTRFGAAQPKQYLMLAGKPVLQHAIERLAFGMPLERTYVLLAKDDRWYERDGGRARRRDRAALRRQHARGNRKERAGCARRASRATTTGSSSTMRSGRASMRLRFPAFASSSADDPVGGLLAVPMASSLKRADGERRITRTEPRDGLWHAQTPQMFRYGLLYEALRASRRQARDRRIAGRGGARHASAPGHGEPHQFQDHLSGRPGACRGAAGDGTQRVDAREPRIGRDRERPLARARRVTRGLMRFRIGNGFDVHALVSGRPLVIGGVTIPFDRGLAGSLRRGRPASCDRRRDPRGPRARRPGDALSGQRRSLEGRGQPRRCCGT